MISRMKMGRFHKRPFVVALIVLLIFVLIGGLLVGYLGFFARGYELDRVRISSEEYGIPVTGFGLSLDHIPTANYVRNPSFENIQMDYMFTVQEGVDNIVYLLMNSERGDYFEDGIFEGGIIRVMSLDEDGRFYQKMESVVEEYNVNQLGLWREFDYIPEHHETSYRFVNASDSQMVGFGDNGYIVSGIGTADVSYIQMDFDGECIASDFSDGYFSALYSNGIILTSVDGRNFNISDDLSINDDEVITLNTISLVNKVVVAAGDDGLIRAVFNGRVSDINPLSDADILTSAGNGDVLLLLGESGEMIATGNGSVFRSLSVDEKPYSVSSIDWVCASNEEDVFVIVGEQGQLAKGYYDSSAETFKFDMLIDTDALLDPIHARDVVIDSSGEIIMLDELGNIFIYNLLIEDWELLSAEYSGDVVSMSSTPNSKIVFLTQNSIYTTSLVIEVIFEDHLTNVDLSAGDMCYLTRQRHSFERADSLSNDGYWEVFSDTATAVSIVDAPVSGAQMSLKLSGQTGDSQSAHYISQTLGVKNQVLFSENNFYRIDLYLKQNGLESGEAMVWLSGDFVSVGTTFSNVGTGWRRYSFRFVMPREACGYLTQDIRLNIGFYGDGELYIDNVFLGRDVHSSGEMAQQFMDGIIEASPQYIRFPSISIGKQGLSVDSFFPIPGNDRLILLDTGATEPTGIVSIESALRLARASEAYPWLVINSSVDQEAINMVMSYLCGSISDPVGKIRVDNGTAVPWSRQFDRFVFEISDSDALFVSDIQRAAYVNYVIELFEASPFYLDMKDRMLFIDSMIYDGGIMLSRADYHASSLYLSESIILSSDTRFDQIQRTISDAYLDYYDGIPRVVARPLDSGGEWINSSTFFLRALDRGESVYYTQAYSINAATQLQFFLHDYGVHTSLISYDVQVSHNPYDLFTQKLFSDSAKTNVLDREIQIVNNNIMLRIMSLLSEYASGTPTIAVITPTLSDVSERVQSGDDNADSNQYEGLVVYSFRDEDQINSFILNVSEGPRSFLIETDFISRDITVSKYSEEVQLIASSYIRRSNVRYVLLPGQFLIVSGLAEEEVFSD